MVAKHPLWTEIQFHWEDLFQRSFQDALLVPVWPFIAGGVVSIHLTNGKESGSVARL